LTNNTNGDGLMCCLWQPTGGLYGQVCSLAQEFAATWPWRWPTFIQVIQSELLQVAGDVDNSTIKVL